MDEQVRKLAGALHKLLTQIGAEERPKTTTLRAYRIAELAEAVERGDFLVADPIGEALRLGVRAVGKAIARVGGIDAMLQVIDALPTELAAFSFLIDRHWDGIADDNGRVWIA